MRSCFSHLSIRDYCCEGLGEGVGGAEIDDICVAVKPCHLLFGIDAGVFLDAGDGGVKVPFAVEIAEQFFVAHSVE